MRAILTRKIVLMSGRCFPAGMELQVEKMPGERERYYDPRAARPIYVGKHPDFHGGRGDITIFADEIQIMEE